MHEEGLGISSFGVDQPKIWVSVVVTPAGTGIEFLLIGIRGSNHHAATLRGSVLFVVASCVQDNVMACLMCGSDRKCNWVTGDCTSKVTRSTLPLARPWPLVAVTWKPTDILYRIALWICRYILFSFFN